MQPLLAPWKRAEGERISSHFPSLDILPIMSQYFFPWSHERKSIHFLYEWETWSTYRIWIILTSLLLWEYFCILMIDTDIYHDCLLLTTPESVILPLRRLWIGEKGAVRVTVRGKWYPSTPRYDRSTEGVRIRDTDPSRRIRCMSRRGSWWSDRREVIHGVRPRSARCRGMRRRRVTEAGSRMGKAYPVWECHRSLVTYSIAFAPLARYGSCHLSEEGTVSIMKHIVYIPSPILDRSLCHEYALVSLI
jgi:hypothetical protein